MNQNLLKGVAFAVVVLSFTWIQAAGQENSITWQSKPGDAVKAAKKQQKLIVVFVTSDACTHCKKLKDETLSNKEVIKTIKKQFVPLAVNARTHRSFVKRLKITAFPTILVTKPDGNIVSSVSGFVTPLSLEGMLITEHVRFAKNNTSTSR